MHEHWGDNLYLTTEIDVNFEAAKAKARTSVTRELRTARQVMSPIEGRGVIAEWNSRLGQLIVTSSTQQSHIVRAGLAECLGVNEGQVRVIAPDVGGGFGYKGILLRRGGGAVLGRRASSGGRFAGSRTGARTSPPAPIAASTIMCSPPMRMGTGASSRSIATRPSMRALIRPIRSRLASKPARSAASCPDSTILRITAAAPTRSRRTSHPSCLTAAWRARAFASRSR